MERGHEVEENILLLPECRISEKGVKFIPPVYIQRYTMIDGVLKKHCLMENIKKVADFGCAELKFEYFYLLKLIGIEEIIAVDVDENLLTRYLCMVEPTQEDYMKPRSAPITIKVFSGSVAYTHEVLNNCDAVVAIELIEHLYPEELDNLPFTIFGYIRPKVAIFTTPNAEFNILFPNFSGCRHDDHKFEWTRQQFEDWGNNLVLRYPDYTVSFQGIGPGPPGTENLGYCSQMATFIKVKNSSLCGKHELHIQDGNYILLKEYVYPHYVDDRTEEIKLKDDISHCILNLQLNNLRLRLQYEEQEKLLNIPLKTIMDQVGCQQIAKLKEILVENHWEIQKNVDGEEAVLLSDSENENDDSLSYNNEAE